MKCYESFVVGIFTGALVLCFFMAFFKEPINCQVRQYVAGNKVAYITYGVSKDE